MCAMTVTSPRTATHGPAPSAAPPSASAEPSRGRNPTVAAVLAALQAAVGGLLAVVVPALAIWMATPRVSVEWPEAVALAVNVWVLGHGAPLSLVSGTVDVVPLGLLAPLLWVAWSGGVRVARAVERRTPGQRRALIGPGGVYVGGYALLATALAGLTGSQDVRASLGAVLLSSALVAGCGLALASYHLWKPERAVLVRLELLARGAGLALVGWFGLALIVLVAGVAVGFDRVSDVQQALHPGGFGHVLLALVQLVLVPTGLVWTASYVTGVGFMVGQGTVVSPFGTELAPVPAIPLLGALPEPGSHPVQAVLLPVLVVAVGAVSGYWVRQRGGERRPIQHALDAALVAVLAVAVMGLLAALSSGSIGPGRMADVGPGVGWLVLVSFSELAVGALLGTFAGPAIMSGRAAARLVGGGRRAVARSSQAAGPGLSATAARARELGSSVAGSTREWGAVAVDRLREAARRRP